MIIDCTVGFIRENLNAMFKVILLLIVWIKIVLAKANDPCGSSFEAGRSISSEKNNKENTRITLEFTKQPFNWQKFC